MRRPAARNVLLSLHIATTVSALGADLVLLALGVAGAAGSDPTSVLPASHLVGSWIMAPLAIASLVTGLSLAVLTRWGLFRYWWVTIKLVIMAALTVLVLLVLVPRLGAAAARVAMGADLSAGERLQLLVTPMVGIVLLVLSIVLAVFKPSRRLRQPQVEERAGALATTRGRGPRTTPPTAGS